MREPPRLCAAFRHVALSDASGARAAVPHLHLAPDGLWLCCLVLVLHVPAWCLLQPGREARREEASRAAVSKYVRVASE